MHRKEGQRFLPFSIYSRNTNLATTNTELEKRTQSLRYVQTTGYITTSVTIAANSYADVVTNITFPSTQTLVAIIPTYMGTSCVCVNSFINSSRYVCFTLRNLTSTARTYDSSTNLAFTILYK